MLQGIKTIVLSVLATTVVGAVFGVLVGALIDQYLIATAILAFLGTSFGLALAYGFLPESEADQQTS